MHRVEGEEGGRMEGMNGEGARVKEREGRAG